jgi:hypothetical protein
MIGAKIVASVIFPFGVSPANLVAVEWDLPKHRLDSPAGIDRCGHHSTSAALGAVLLKTVEHPYLSLCY